MSNKEVDGREQRIFVISSQENKLAIFKQRKKRRQNRVSIAEENKSIEELWATTGMTHLIRMRQWLFWKEKGRKPQMLQG